LALAYIDARNVMDRLDEVVGPDAWQDAYEVLAGGTVKCSLQLWFGCCWVQKEDVGGQSDQSDTGDKAKAAFSDALKRAAVKFGIGRYLYALPAQWRDYDPKIKQFVTPPQLPAWADPLTAILANWKADVEAMNTAEELNAAAPAMAKLPEGAKPRLWALLKDHAAKLGLEWSKERKTFFNPKEKPA
jgi:hypothetical protein